MHAGFHRSNMKEVAAGVNPTPISRYL